MESDRRIKVIKVIEIQEKHIPKILAMGLMLSSLLIIFSVDSLYQQGKYFELAISTGLFAGNLLIMRWLNSAK